MKKHLLVLRCEDCRHRYKRLVEVDDELGETIDDVPNPPCPKCTKAKTVERRDAFETAMPPLAHDGIEGVIAEQRAPGIGGAAVVKQIDQAANIVMADYGLTDLKDNIRQGETMAPRLPPAQQKAADNFFGPPKGTPNKRQQAQMKNIMRRAIGGAYKASALDVKAVLPDARVALRRVGSEPVQH